MSRQRMPAQFWPALLLASCLLARAHQAQARPMAMEAPTASTVSSISLDAAAVAAPIPDGLPTSGTTSEAVLSKLKRFSGPVLVAAVTRHRPSYAAQVAAAEPQAATATDGAATADILAAAAGAAATAATAPADVVQIVDTPVPRTAPVDAAAVQQTAVLPDAVTVAAAAPSQYQGIFDQHNYYRSIHRVPALTWSTSLASDAAAYASQCQWGHDPSVQGQEGENLYATSATNNPSGALMDTIKAWYNEISYYDYSNPGFSGATGHFTQVVWKSTTSIGCAVQVCGPGFAGWSSGGTYVVCRYSPPGNYVGGTYFEDNVLPPQSNPPPTPPPRPPPTPPPTPPPVRPSPTPNPSNPSIPAGTLPEGYQFTSPGCLVAANKKYWVCMQNDANMVLFNAYGKAIWTSNTAGYSRVAPFKVVMQAGGNLNIYDSTTPTNTWLWTTNTAGKGTAPRRLVVQDDGNMVIYDKLNKALWATYTAGK